MDVLVAVVEELLAIGVFDSCDGFGGWGEGMDISEVVEDLVSFLSN